MCGFVAKCGIPVLRKVVVRQDDDRHFRVFQFYLLGQFKATLVGESDIHEDEIRMVSVNLFKGLAPIGGFEYHHGRETGEQAFGEDLTKYRAVIDDEGSHYRLDHWSLSIP